MRRRSEIPFATEQWRSIKDAREAMQRVGLSTSPNTRIATVFDLPGCSYTAATDDEMNSMLPLVIAEHFRWLSRHGEHVADGDARVTIEEEIDPRGAEGVEGEFVFVDDRRPLTPDEIDRTLRYMQYARGDLLAVVTGLSDELLDWRPPTSAMARIEPWKPTPLTIREILRDLASAEFYYRTALSDGRSVDDDPPRELADLHLQRERSIMLLSSLSPLDNGRVFAPQRPWQEGAERWAARKVARRIISHERFHTAEIQQRLAWLLLGVPNCI